MSDVSKNSLGVLLVVISAMAFAAKSIFVKVLYVKGIDPVTLLALRFAIALPLFWLAVFIFPSGKVGLRDMVILVLSGLFGIYASALANFYGLLYIDATLERVILYASPAMLIMLNAAIFRQRLSTIAIFALALIYGGLAMTLKIWGASFSANMIGVGLVLFSALVSAVWYVMVEYFGARVSGVKLSAYTMTAPTFAFIATWAVQGAAMPGDAAGWELIAALAVVSTLLPVLGLTIGIKLIGSGKAALASFIGPVFTAIMAWLFLGETMDALQVIGMAVVMAGVYMTSTVKAALQTRGKEAKEKEEKDLNITPSIAD